MISHPDWDRLSDDEKFEFLYRHASDTEANYGRLAAAAQGLLDRILKLEKALADNAP
jgi:hypothetical protein